jgi:hypothetical protein
MILCCHKYYLLCISKAVSIRKLHFTNLTVPTLPHTSPALRAFGVHATPRRLHLAPAPSHLHPRTRTCTCLTCPRTHCTSHPHPRIRTRTCLTCPRTRTRTRPRTRTCLTCPRTCTCPRTHTCPRTCTCTCPRTCTCTRPRTRTCTRTHPHTRACTPARHRHRQPHPHARTLHTGTGTCSPSPALVSRFEKPLKALQVCSELVMFGEAATALFFHTALDRKRARMSTHSETGGGHGRLG